LLSRQQVRFPDRLVILGYARFEQWRNFPGLLQYLAELREANIVAGEFTSLPPAGQAEFINRLLERTTCAAARAVRVCILDTGVDRGHLLLEQSLAEQDLQAWDDEWGVTIIAATERKWRASVFTVRSGSHSTAMRKLGCCIVWNRSRFCHARAKTTRRIMGRLRSVRWLWLKQCRRTRPESIAWL